MAEGGGGTSILVITGPIGVGKTVVMWEVGEQLEAAAMPHAMVDFDDLVWSYPRPPEDPFNLGIGFENLRCVWSNYSARGIVTLLVAYVLETREGLRRFEEVIPGARLTVCRLRATADTLEERLLRREVGSDRERQLRRSVELSQQFDRHEVGDFVVDVDGRSVPTIAALVLRQWASRAGSAREFLGA